MSKVILKLGNDISTDDIYPGRYMATVLPTTRLPVSWLCPASRAVRYPSCND